MALHKIAGAWITPTRDGGVVIRIPGFLGNNTVVLLPNRYKDTERHPDYNVLVEILTEEERKAREDYRENGDMVKNAVSEPSGRDYRPIQDSAPRVDPPLANRPARPSGGSEKLPELPDVDHVYALGHAANGSPVWEPIHKDDIRTGDILRSQLPGYFFKSVPNPVTPNGSRGYSVTGRARGKTEPTPDHFDRPVPTTGNEDLADPFAE